MGQHAVRVDNRYTQNGGRDGYFIGRSWKHNTDNSQTLNHIIVLYFIF
jgi:hypothetical protein